MLDDDNGLVAGTPTECMVAVLGDTSGGGGLEAVLGDTLGSGGLGLGSDELPESLAGPPASPEVPNTLNGSLSHGLQFP